VPAAAVIPAPIAYAKVVAVKKLVVEFLIIYFCLIWNFFSKKKFLIMINNNIFDKFLIIY
jgi:hypothetical protein